MDPRDDVVAVEVIRRVLWFHQINNVNRLVDHCSVRATEPKVLRKNTIQKLLILGSLCLADSLIQRDELLHLIGRSRWQLRRPWSKFETLSAGSIFDYIETKGILGNKGSAHGP